MAIRGFFSGKPKTAFVPSRGQSGASQNVFFRSGGSTLWAASVFDSGPIVSNAGISSKFAQIQTAADTMAEDWCDPVEQQLRRSARMAVSGAPRPFGFA